MIEKYINNISQTKSFSLTTFKDEVDITFLGDGEGDFEKYENDATEEALEDYIAHCHKQIKLAQTILKGKQDERK